jgi:dethiobiotin synthetase
MQIFIAGTDTNIGKTVVSSWICLHSGYSYFKPIQAGTEEETDSEFVKRISSTKVYPESYMLKRPLSPHLAAELENVRINPNSIRIPLDSRLIVEGAGGLFVPLDKNYFILDFIQSHAFPVILVARSTLGTINHTLLSLEALRARHINILGVVMNGPKNSENLKAIEEFGRVPVLAELYHYSEVSREILKTIKLPDRLERILGAKEC